MYTQSVRAVGAVITAISRLYSTGAVDLLTRGRSKISREAPDGDRRAAGHEKPRIRQGGALKPKTLDTACFLLLQALYLIGISGAKVEI